MRAFLRVAAVLLVVVAMMSSCQNERPGEIEDQSDMITEPNYATMSTTFECSTGTQFLNAQSNYSPGDTIKLLVDDPGPTDLFILIAGTSSSSPLDDLTLIGCDENPSEIAVDYFSVTSIYAENSTLENVSLLWGQATAGTINLQGTSGTWNGVHIAPLFEYPTAINFLGDTSGGDYTFVDCVNLDPTLINCGPDDVDLTIDGCELTDSNDACDPADIESDCNVVLESWELDGESYSFETLPSITNLTLVSTTLAGRSGCKALVKFKINWNGFVDNASIADIYVDHGDNACTTETTAWKDGDWYKASFAVNYFDCDFRWRARVVLCEDSDESPSVTSSCRYEDIVCGVCY